jgi:site-specific recombinase XerD
MGTVPAVTENRLPAPVHPLRGAPVASTPEQLYATLAAVGAPEDFIKVTSTWIGLKRSEHTKAAYAKDAGWWLKYCNLEGISLFTAEPTDADGYLIALRETGLAESTIARRLAAASSWYVYLKRARLVDHNPFEGMERPKLDDDSPTVGLSIGEVGQLLARARNYETTRTYSLFVFLAETGARVTSALHVTVGDIHRHDGHDAVWLGVKGGKKKRAKLAPAVVAAIEEHKRAEGITQPDEYLFATSSGRPMDRAAVVRLLRRVAADAGIANAAKLSPHSLRHSFATAGFKLGKSLADIQDAMMHADPRTTRRYDQDQGKLDRSPASAIADAFGAAMRAAEAQTSTAPAD